MSLKQITGLSKFRSCVEFVEIILYPSCHSGPGKPIHESLELVCNMNEENLKFMKN